jgi:protein tyrosine phosphatase
MTYLEGSSNYINAVFSDGYKQRDAFIVTQMPLPQTACDFWTMCYDHEISAVIMMNELDTSDPVSESYEL